MSAKRLSAKGFTIMETMIVLAVAGLILMIALIAIPTLERNSRNNQRKQDVQRVLEAVSQYELNNSGNFPNTAQLQALLTHNVRLTVYEIADVSANSRNANQSVGADNPNPHTDTVAVYNHQKCTNGGGTATPAGAAYNDVVALFAFETGNGVLSRCQEL